MVKVTDLCYVVILFNICEPNLNLCESPNGYLEVEEGKQNNTFTCSGLTQAVSVSWTLDYGSNNTTPFSKCSSQSSSPCSQNLYTSTFSISRTNDASTITVNETAIGRSDYFKNSSLLCQTSTESGEILNKTRCQFDLIIPATGVVCRGEFNSSVWALTGQCDVARANSPRGRYYCLVYQNNQKSSFQGLVGNFTMSSPDSYGNRTCQINSPLPPVGNYSYNVVITPGQTQMFLSLTGSGELRRPSRSPSHNCPPYVEENDDVNCSCFATDLGKPSGLVKWTETGLSELRLEKVNRTQHDKTYTCSLMWNNTDVLRVNYTLQVNYSSSVLTFKINNMDVNIMNVTENKDMTVVCTADGRPKPSLSLFKTFDNQELKLAGVNDSNELIHNITAVTCQAAGSYICHSENIIGVDKKSIQVFVLCSPRRLTNESYITTVDGEEASFEMIAYPDPDSLIIVIESSLNTTSTKPEANISTEYKCTRNHSFVHKTTCNVIFRNKTVYSHGLYIAIFSNAFGNVSFTFEMKEGPKPATKLTEPSGAPQIKEENITVPVVGGVIGGVLVAVLVVVIIILVVRRKGTSKKGLSQSTEVIHHDFNEQEQNEETETDVDKSRSQSTTTIDSTTKDVYSVVVKRGVKPTSTDSTDSTTTPTNEDVAKNNKGKVKLKKTSGEGKKKEKGGFSKSPSGASKYETFGFDQTQRQKTKGTKEIERRDQQNLNYTIVVFDDTSSTSTPTPTSDRTLYAEIVGGNMLKL